MRRHSRWLHLVRMWWLHEGCRMQASRAHRIEAGMHGKVVQGRGQGVRIG